MNIQNLSASDKALFDDLMCIADAKMVLAGWYMVTLPNGRAIGDWSALSGMMQDHYGHARALFAYLERYGLTRSDAEWSRTASEIRSPEMLDRPPGSWTDLIVSAHLMENALLVHLGAHADSDSDPELAGLARKIMKESRFHLSYLNGWLKVLRTSQAGALDAAMRERFFAMLRWWGPAGAPDPAFAEGRRARSLTDMRQAWVEAVSWDEAEPGALANASDAGEWDASTMRSGKAGIPESLYELIRFKHIELAMP